MVAPDIKVKVSQPGFSDGFMLENGGQTSVRSAAAAKVYDFVYNVRRASDLAPLRRLRQGSLGSGLVYFADPDNFTSNLFSPAWAEPGLIEQGWPTIYDTDPSGYANVSTNSYDQPLRKATFDITQDANTAPSGAASRFIIPIPADKTLHLGVSGAATGTAVVYVTAYNIGAGSSSGGALTLLTDTSSTRLNATYSGASYNYVAVDFRRTSSAASTLTITSMLAQLHTTGGSPTLTGNHQPGEGHTGLRMLGWDEEYIAADARSLAFQLVEVGAWLL